MLPARPFISQDDRFKRFDDRGFQNAGSGEGAVNVGKTLCGNRDVLWTSGINQEPAQPPEATTKTNSVQMIRQIDCRCAVVDMREMVGEAVLPSLGNRSNLGGAINSTKRPNNDWQ